MLEGRENQTWRRRRNPPQAKNKNDDERGNW